MADRRRFVVLVTGASTGIGNSCATALAKNGYTVYGTSRFPETRPRRADEFFELIRLEVSDDDSVGHAISYILAKEGRLDVLVHNAGIGITGSVEETPTLEAAKLLDVNVMGTVRLLRAVLPGMRKDGGAILVIGSMAGLTGVPFHAYYAASKFAVEGLIESLRMEMTGFPVRISLIEPGIFRRSRVPNRTTFGLADPSPYSENGRRTLTVLEQGERAGADPILVARLVMKLIEKKRLKPRYRVGFWYHRSAMVLKRMLPYRITEWMVRAYFDIRRDM